MKISTSLVKSRIKKLSDVVDAPVIIPRWEWYNPNFTYFCGVDLDHCALLIEDENLTIFTTRLNESLCKEVFKNIADVIVFTKMEDVKKRLSAKTLIDASHIPYTVYRLFKVKPLKKELLNIREIKDNREIEYIKEARRITLKILQKVDVDGLSEKDVKRNINVEMAKMGVHEAFDTIVANSRNARFPHYTSGNAVIRDYALIDMGVKYNFYNADLTRCIGELKRMEGVYERLKQASEEMCDYAYSGMSISEFIKNVEKILKRNMLKPMPHSIGHGIGLEVHEFPLLNKKAKGELKENSVITLEPGQYDRVGLRYEDVYVITKKGARVVK